MKDAEISEIHESREHKAENVRGSFTERLPKSAILFGGLAIAIIVYSMYTKKLDTTKGLFWIAAAVIIAILLGGDPKRRELNFNEICDALITQLTFLQHHSFGDHAMIPEGSIRLEPAARKRFMDGKSWKRELGVSVETRDYLKKYYSCELDVYTGDMLSIVPRDERFTGKEAPDVKVIPTEEDIMKKKRAEWGDYGMRAPK